ncbi:hypothetical protein SEMRO_1184_G250140.1 [Seminavis robusta]|uniref:Uncharacterized protein n=1 Tax=Seminavis robusta TaxID=568900 RepID=A0A9N8EMM5_9STRA|nr:hypothetical protein SEMRO_1184_G250140.1 [Seminavis robusta]|eukprot:Sro1184_g250140.1 n/a (249) ;mRNA; f:21622-22368
MSMLLAVGYKGGLSAIKSQWLKCNNDSGYQVHVSQNIEKPKARYFSVCFTAPKTKWKTSDCCKAHVKAVGDNREDMTITSYNPVHTCSRTESSIRRKRNYLSKDIVPLSDALSLYVPTGKREGNTKQYQTIASNATGISIKTGQASLAVRSMSSTTLEAQIGQYFWIQSLLQAYYESDPSGTFAMQYDDCPWDDSLQQFVRCYIALSFAKEFWRQSEMSMNSYPQITGVLREGRTRSEKSDLIYVLRT